MYKTVIMNIYMYNKYVWNFYYEYIDINIYIYIYVCAIHMYVCFIF